MGRFNAQKSAEFSDTFFQNVLQSRKAMPLNAHAGLPLGVQIFASRFRKDLCLQAAAVIEAAEGPSRADRSALVERRLKAPGSANPADIRERFSPTNSGREPNVLKFSLVPNLAKPTSMRYFFVEFGSSCLILRNP